MSKNISELFTRNRPTINMPSNSSETQVSRESVVQQLDMGGKIENIPSNNNNNSDGTHLDKVEKISEGMSLQDRVLLSSYSLIGDALKKAGITDPVDARKFIYKTIEAKNKLPSSVKSEVIDGKRVTYDLEAAGKKIVKMRSYLFSDASDAIGTAITTGMDVVRGIFSKGDQRGRTNYTALHLLLNNPLMANSILGGVGRAVSGLLGGDVMISKEFDKSRQSPHLPAHKKGEKTGKDFNSKISFYEQETTMPPTAEENKGIWGNLKDAAIDYAKDLVGITDVQESMPARKILYNTLKVKEDKKLDYLKFYDPFSTIDPGSPQNIGSMLGWLRDAGYLNGYSDFAGFEIGTDNQWRIQIYPYPHEDVDIDMFNSLGRKSCVPGLPYYYLPNYWIDTPIRSKGYTKNYSGPLDMDGTVREVITNNLVSMPKASAKGTNVDPYYNSYENTGALFSYSDYTPVLNYDLNFGTVKTDSLKLFNGSVSEIFLGMNYNITMNMSILDDAYSSMQKYMQYYINCVYDLHSQGLAAYYSCAFQINLIIFRSGYQVKNAFKLIGVPIEYTPRFSGTQDANEARIDITFGIIGLIPPRKISNGVMNSHADTKPMSNNIYTDPKTISWNDVNIKLNKT